MLMLFPTSYSIQMKMRQNLFLSPQLNFGLGECDNNERIERVDNIHTYSTYTNNNDIIKREKEKNKNSQRAHMHGIST